MNVAVNPRPPADQASAVADQASAVADQASAGADQASASADLAGLAARAAAIAPLVAAMADEVEASRGLPPSLLDALHGAGLFRSLLPRAYGGDESDPATHMRMLETIARADASTAWCLSQAAGCSMAAAYLDPAVAREIWGEDPRAVLAWGAGPQGIAVAVPGGYRVTGTWGFASGSRHATWVGGHCRVTDPDGSVRLGAHGAKLERTMLFPRERAEWVDDWHVMGLRGTGSDSYTVRDLFVPDQYTVERDTDDDRRVDGPLYAFTTTNCYASGFAGVALGIARGALDALIELAHDKTPALSGRAMRDSPTVQSAVAQAECKLGGARALLLSTLQDAWAGATTTGHLTLDQTMAIRMASTWAIQQAREVTASAYQEAGSTAVFASGPFERRFRDANAVSQQVQGRPAHFETVGRHILERGQIV